MNTVITLCIALGGFFVGVPIGMYLNSLITKDLINWIKNK